MIREGAQGYGFYVLSIGSVSMYESTEVKGTLHPGMGFGEIALLYSCPRTETVRAREECDLWFMDRRAFMAIVAKHKRKRLRLKHDGKSEHASSYCKGLSDFSAHHEHHV